MAGKIYHVVRLYEPTPDQIEAELTAIDTAGGTLVALVPLPRCLYIDGRLRYWALDIVYTE